MKISGSYQMACSPEQAYALLQDPEALARCMPGCESLDRIGENEYAMKMKMALAAFSGLFEGKVRIADTKPPQSFRLIVEGSGRVGFMKGEGLLNLSAQNGGTEVAYEGDVHVGGTIAAVGQRLLDSTAKVMIKRFFDKLGEGASARA
ncbi:MAG: carbon monoxide dehydrogenase subunit G [Acidimicrobiia bacterium]|nr:carbon monoxide dehydrogenase subunit G [Acidimicrobiia bacterium]